MRKILTVLVFSFSFLAASSPAKAALSGEYIFTKCGLGGMVFPDKPVLALTLNFTYDLGTTALTSGVLESGCSGSSYQSAKLVYEKYAAIEAETAIGSGEHVAALMDIYGCDSKASEAVMAQTRVGFAEMVGSSNYSEISRLQKVKTYHQIVDRAALSNCTIS